MTVRGVKVTYRAFQHSDERGTICEQRPDGRTGRRDLLVVKKPAGVPWPDRRLLSGWLRRSEEKRCGSRLEWDGREYKGHLVEPGRGWGRKETPDS